MIIQYSNIIKIGWIIIKQAKKMLDPKENLVTHGRNRNQRPELTSTEALAVNSTPCTKN